MVQDNIESKVSAPKKKSAMGAIALTAAIGLGYVLGNTNSNSSDAAVQDELRHQVPAPVYQMEQEEAPQLIQDNQAVEYTTGDLDGFLISQVEKRPLDVGQADRILERISDLSSRLDGHSRSVERLNDANPFTTDNFGSDAMSEPYAEALYVMDAIISDEDHTRAERDIIQRYGNYFVGKIATDVFTQAVTENGDSVRVITSRAMVAADDLATNLFYTRETVDGETTWTFDPSPLVDELRTDVLNALVRAVEVKRDRFDYRSGNAPADVNERIDQMKNYINE